MIDLVHKLPDLDQRLFELLEGRSAEDWNRSTVARLWQVKDVAAHLLDGNIRVLSMLRDRHYTEAPEINSYQGLVDHLNQLNADWVQAMKRVSPRILLELLKVTGPPYCAYYASLNPLAKAEWAVAWAGEEESTNWMHIAREYTEKFLHQQQIRDAVDQQGIMTEDFYLPFLEVCMYALPYSLRKISAAPDSILKMEITGKVSGEWFVRFTGYHWERTTPPFSIDPVAVVSINYYASWKLFSKSLRPTDLKDQISIQGDQRLGNAAAEMVAFMA
ncbi:MAG: maleylpyruvate isomerase N-terminal domain-containing protein [Bacteroidota bacterium]